MVAPGHPLPVVRQCRLLDVPRSSFYYRPTVASEADVAVMCWIDAVHLEFRFYGSWRVQDELERGGAPGEPEADPALDAAHGNRGLVSEAPGRAESRKTGRFSAFPAIQTLASTPVRDSGVTRHRPSDTIHSCTTRHMTSLVEHCPTVGASSTKSIVASMRREDISLSPMSLKTRTRNAPSSRHWISVAHSVPRTPPQSFTRLTASYNFERTLQEKCRLSRLSRIAGVLDSGTLRSPSGDPAHVVQYLIFEMAQHGDVRDLSRPTDDTRHVMVSTANASVRRRTKATSLRRNCSSRSKAIERPNFFRSLGKTSRPRSRVRP